MCDMSQVYCVLREAQPFQVHSCSAVDKHTHADSILRHMLLHDLHHASDVLPLPWLCVSCFQVCFPVVGKVKL